MNEIQKCCGKEPNSKCHEKSNFYYFECTKCGLVIGCFNDAYHAEHTWNKHHLSIKIVDSIAKTYEVQA